MPDVHMCKPRQKWMADSGPTLIKKHMLPTVVELFLTFRKMPTSSINIKRVLLGHWMLRPKAVVTKV